MPKKKAKSKATAPDIEELEEELEFFVIDDQSLINLVEQVTELSYAVNELRNDNESLHEQVAELEKRVRAARYN